MSKQLTAEEVIERIVQHTGKTYDEVKDLVTKTRESLNNFVNEQGAAYLLANNLEVPLVDNSTRSSQAIPINEVVEGMGPITIIGRISKIYNTRHSVRKDHTPGQVRRLELVDSTGKINVTLWNEKTKVVEELGLEVGRIVRISNAEPRMGLNDEIELSLGSRAIVDDNVIGIDETDFPTVEVPKLMLIGDINKEQNNITIAGKIIKRNGITEFERNDGTIGKVTNIVIKDTSGQIRVTFWDSDVNYALAFDEGQVVKLTNLKSYVNNNVWELSFQSYSSISPYSSEELDELTTDYQFGDAEFKLIKEITEETKNVSVLGRVVSIQDSRTFMTEKGEGKIQSVILGDKSGLISVNFWGDDVKYVESIQIDDILKITNTYTRYNDYSQRVELNVGRSSTVEINPQLDDQAKEFLEVPYVLFEDITENLPAVFIRTKVVGEPIERTTIRKTDGTEAKVVNIEVMDENGETGRIAAWDDDISLINDLNVDDTIEVRLARAKRDEFGVSITLGRNSKIVPITDFDETNTLLQTADKLKQSEIYEKVELDKIEPNMNVFVEATIVKIFPRVAFYDSCNQCQRKAMREETGELICKEHGNIANTRKRMILTVTLDDNSSATMKAKFFNDLAEELIGMSAAEAYEINERIGEDGAVIEQVKSIILLKPLWAKAKATKDNVSGETVLDIRRFGWLDPHKKTDEILSRYKGI